MSHTVTSKLNKDARQHPMNDGMIFFVSLGEQNYNRKTKAKEWTNYDAALFASGGQVGFYQQVLVAGAIISVSGTGIILAKQDGQDANGVPYKDKLEIQDAKLVGNWDGQAAPQQQAQQAPQQQPQQMQQPQQGGFVQQGQYPQQQPMQQQQHQQAPVAGPDQLDGSNIPF